MVEASDTLAYIQERLGAKVIEVLQPQGDDVLLLDRGNFRDSLRFLKEDEKLAFDLLLNTRYPSWGYVVEHGGTTTWERWNGDQMKSDPSMNSYNHYAYGAVADWMYRYAAGVDATPLDAGFHTVVLHPQFDARLGHVEFSYPSSYGVIRSAWTATGNNVEWKVTIPANTMGEIGAKEVEKWKLASAGLDGIEKSAAGMKLAAGSYTFTATLK